MSRMPLATLATVVAVGMIVAIPTLAQQIQGNTAPPGREETVPFQLNAAQIGQMQRKLNQLGFSAGHVDGFWGPETSTAVLHFQQMSGMQATGKLDDATLRALGLTGAAAASPTTAAQAAPPQATPAPAMIIQPAPVAPPVAASGRAMDSTSSAGTTTASPLPVPGPNAPASTSGAAPGTNPGDSAGRARADGNSNQAVATTNANALQPARGANSFTRGEAQARIAREGFQNLADLSKDNAGVWRGKATRNGQPVRVWLDYKGSVGQQ